MYEMLWKEACEIIGDWMEEYQEWLDYEADMETNPFAEYDRPPFEE